MPAKWKAKTRFRHQVVHQAVCSLPSMKNRVAIHGKKRGRKRWEKRRSAQEEGRGKGEEEEIEPREWGPLNGGKKKIAKGMKMETVV